MKMKLYPALIAPVTLLVLAGCDIPLREASCSCFKDDGTASEACDFAPVPTDPAVYTLSSKSEPC